VLARDSRTSGPMFSRIVAGALQSVGCDVVEIGIAPTPTALYNIKALGADGGSS
jgi:phosphomannomutase